MGDRNALPGSLNLEGNIANNWRMFYQEFDIYMISTEQYEKSEKVKIALFLRSIGSKALDIYNSFEFEDKDEQSLQEIIDKFENYCIPPNNVTRERYSFFTRSQRKGESIDSFVTDLRKKAQSCEFGDMKESLVKDMIVVGVNSQAMRAKLLTEIDLNQIKAVEICKMIEFCDENSGEGKSRNKPVKKPNTGPPESKKPAHPPKQQQPPPQVVHVPRQPKKPHHPQQLPPGNRDHSEPQATNKFVKDCLFCGTSHLYGRVNCPAGNKECNKCHAMGHVSQKCRNLPGNAK